VSASSSCIGRRLCSTLGIDSREAAPVALAAAYGFCILFAYYLLRPVRDEIAAADRGNLQLLWTAVFLVMLGAVPLYSATVSRLRRGTFVPLANRFFAICLLLFYGALVLLPETARPWIDRSFYVWLSVFALFVVTVFWGLVVDLFDGGQGRRLFGLVALGASLGGIAGSGTAAALATTVPVFLFLLMAVLPLEVASWLARALDRCADRAGASLRREPEAPVGGTAWSGIATVFADPQLRRIALWILAMTLASTTLYFTQSQLLGETLPDRAARREFLARVDLAVNLLTLIGQALLAAPLICRFGLGITLALLPAVTVFGFSLLGASLWAAPAAGSLLALAIVRVAYDSTRHALAKPAREVLFTGVAREARFKSKAFVDAAVYRGGDLLSSWCYVALLALGLTSGLIALLLVPMAVGWAFLGRRLGAAEGYSR
jgi:AAA family ATP:ADP antiporter